MTTWDSLAAIGVILLPKLSDKYNYYLVDKFLGSTEGRNENHFENSIKVKQLLLPQKYKQIQKNFGYMPLNCHM